MCSLPPQRPPICVDACCPPRNPLLMKWQPCVDFSALEGATTGVKQNIADLSASGKYYVSPEICRELRHIDCGVNHIHLDHDILKNENWKRKCDPADVFIHRQGATNVLQSATEKLLDVKGRQEVTGYHSLVDNKARETHHLTIQDLKEIERDMRPYAHDSMVRLKHYCDHVGVSDRYTGYRHNLNRGNRDPINLAFSWFDPAGKHPHTGIKLRAEADKIHHRRECIEKFPKAGRAKSAPTAKVKNPCIKPLSIEEQCGINLTYPGTTEYTDRYVAPPRDKPTSDFIINPVADYRIDGRPLARQSFHCTETEYQVRYDWPDGERLMKFPWLRK